MSTTNNIRGVEHVGRDAGRGQLPTAIHIPSFQGLAVVQNPAPKLVDNGLSRLHVSTYQHDDDYQIPFVVH